MLPTQNEAIAKFIFLTFLDDSLALEAIPFAIRHFESVRRKESALTDAAIVVMSTRLAYDSFRPRLLRGKPGFQLNHRWMIVKDLDFAPWQEFQKKSMEDELHILVWSRVLGYEYKDIAEGLGVTEGTVRFRMNRALRKLGESLGGL